MFCDEIWLKQRVSLTQGRRNRGGRGGHWPPPPIILMGGPGFPNNFDGALGFRVILWLLHAVQLTLDVPSPKNICFRRLCNTNFSLTEETNPETT